MKDILRSEDMIRGSRRRRKKNLTAHREEAIGEEEIGERHHVCYTHALALVFKSYLLHLITHLLIMY